MKETAKESTIESRHQRCLADLQTRSQAHVLRWWDELTPPQRQRLLADLESIPWGVVDGLIQSHVLHKPAVEIPADLSPPVVHPPRPGRGRESAYKQAVNTGRDVIRRGKAAAFTVAGGQGSRLGYEGPKGMVEVTPVGQRTLFQWFAETVRSARLRYETSIPWYVMTSPTNHDQTVAYFKQQGYFGLPQEDVVLFSQGMLPAFDFQGRLLMETKHRLALAPDGHGGSLKALVKSGALSDMQSRGVTIISYFQIDNPLAVVADPTFIGYHDLESAEMSTKVIPKRDRSEKVGVVGFCMGGGLSLWLATMRPEISAAVPFYGGLWEGVDPDFTRSRAAFLGHYAEHDEWATPESAQRMESTLRSQGREATFHVYQGTHHAFFNDERPEVYDADAAQLAWDRTVAFFRAHLG